MKKITKRIIHVAVVSIVAMVLLLSAWGISAAAASSISTNGNIDFEGGTVGIYADDFNYLQGEIEALFNEIN